MVYHLNSGIDTAPLQNSSYTTPIVPEIPVIVAQNNRGFLLPVTVVVISRPLIQSVHEALAISDLHCHSVVSTCKWSLEFWKNQLQLSLPWNQNGQDLFAPSWPMIATWRFISMNLWYPLYKESMMHISWT
jgi:hypothetical protein